MTHRSITEIQQDLDLAREALRNRIKGGGIAGRNVAYISIAELRTLIADFENELARAEASPTDGGGSGSGGYSSRVRFVR